MDKTAFLNITTSNKMAENRTSPVYVAEIGKLSLQDILNKKPEDFNKQIDISWINDALNKKAMEVKYAPWDAISMPYGLWSYAAYGNNTIIVASSDGNIAISLDYCKSFQKYKICNNITGIAYGKNIFVIISSNGKIYISKNNGLSWQDISYYNYNFTAIAYNNGIFLLGTSCGKIFTTTDFTNFILIADYNNITFTKILYINNIIIALTNNENKNLIYSTNFGATWHKFNTPFSQNSAITYGNSKFIVCSLNSNQICICYEKDIINNNPHWQNITLYKNEVFSDISYKSNVFCMVSLSGVIMASYDGIKWIETKCPAGAWTNILATDYFFITFSISENKDNLYAAKSSNGGLLGIMFASLEEVITYENVNKAINPYTLKDYLKYRTGKNKGQYPVYSEDLLIECTSSDTRQIKIINITNQSNIENVNNITTAGIYIIEKKLINLPLENNITYLLVQKDENKIYQFASSDYNFTTGFKREYNTDWQEWQKVILSEHHINIKQESTFNTCQHILMNDENSIKKVDKFDMLENITRLLLENGKNYFWKENQNYSKGALILGSDNALYYCTQENGVNNNQNPLLSPTYWVKIINSNGKINAENLSLILGEFALLNEISLQDNRLKDILPIDKGGTGANNFQNAINNLLENVSTTSTISDSEFLYAYTSNNVCKVSLATLNHLLKASLPIGFIYMQLREQETPDKIFNTTGAWQDISHLYAGRFFRVTGGSAASFGSQQSQGLPNIQGNLIEAILFKHDAKYSSSGVFKYNITGQGGYSGGANLNIGKLMFNANYSNSLYGAANEVRPINETIRIWKKITY